MRESPVHLSTTHPGGFRVLPRLGSISRVSSTIKANCSILSQNRDGIYLLAARSGYLFSVARLNDFATALSRAKADNLDLFPFGASEKLASLTL